MQAVEDLGEASEIKEVTAKSNGKRARQGGLCK
jgi:hypothetical protein